MAGKKVRRSGHRPRSAKRAMREQIERAISELGRTPPLRDVSVHEARKELKRARSALRLLRDAIGETAYRRVNERLRDAARPLARVRDAKVLIEVVETLRAETKQASRRAELVSLEQKLRRERRQARSEVLKRPARLREIQRSLDSVLSNSRPWRTPTDDSLRRGIERIYRELHQQIPLLGCLHPLGDHLHAIDACERHDRRSDGFRICVVTERAHEGAIHLQHSDR
jgi:CHAD domain-containing protein